MDLFPAVTDPTGAITQPGSQTIALQPGDYLVSYKVSATLNQPGYMQVTPSYGGAPHLEYGVYFATTATGSSAVGSAHFILPAPSAATFSPDLFRLCPGPERGGKPHLPAPAPP